MQVVLKPDWARPLFTQPFHAGLGDLIVTITISFIVLLSVNKDLWEFLQT